MALSGHPQPRLTRLQAARARKMLVLNSEVQNHALQTTAAESQRSYPRWMRYAAVVQPSRQTPATKTKGR